MKVVAEGVNNSVEGVGRIIEGVDNIAEVSCSRSSFPCCDRIGTARNQPSLLCVRQSTEAEEKLSAIYSLLDINLMPLISSVFLLHDGKYSTKRCELIGFYGYFVFMSDYSIFIVCKHQNR
ncbi:MAG: hypothetical protein RRZ65_00650 [Tannerellaceae bacterium]